MGRQDFAHNAAPTKVKPASGTTSLASVIAIIFIASACFTAGYWIGSGDIQSTGVKTDTDAIEAKLAVKEADLRLQQAKIETLEALVEQWKSKAGAAAHTKIGELNFYKELPKQSVMPAPVSAKSTASAAKIIAHATTSPSHTTIVIEKAMDTSPTGSILQNTNNHAGYRIQIASFRHHKDAIPVQQKLLKAGFPAFIQEVTLADKGIWFRAYAGPFTSKSAAEDSQQRMQQQLNLKGLLVREQ